MTNHPTRGLPVSGVARNAFPGDHIYTMTRGHSDERGNEYAAGTEYAPLSCGADGTHNGTKIAQTVIIGGENIIFRH